MTMEEVAARNNLAAAFRQVASNNGAAGPDGQSVAEVRKHLGRVLDRLHRELLEGTYRPGLIRRVWIPKPGGERGLGIPNVIDRIVGQAVHQVLGPHYEPTFHSSSHGFRPGRSCHTAIAEAKQHVEEGYEWVVDLDLSKFFDRVHHDRLMARLAHLIDDARVLQLIRRMLKAKVVMPDGVVVSTDEGTPQGGPLSPLLSNIVLDELDWELARRGHRFVRYADDANIFVQSERAGRRVMASVVRFIEGRLRLVVNADKSAVARPEERHFLGFRLRRVPESGAVEVLLSQRSKKRIDRKIREMVTRRWGQSMMACIRKLNVYLLGWIGYFWICTEPESRTLHNLDAHIRRRLRALQLTQWKRRRTIAARLIQLGAKPGAVYKHVFHGKRRWWALAYGFTVGKALSQKHFAELGLVSIEERWRDLHTRTIIGSAQLNFGLG
jgi:RNA-directed DNA polymerase